MFCDFSFAFSRWPSIQVFKKEAWEPGRLISYLIFVMLCRTA